MRRLALFLLASCEPGASRSHRSFWLGSLAHRSLIYEEGARSERDSLLLSGGQAP